MVVAIYQSNTTGELPEGDRRSEQRAEGIASYVIHFAAGNPRKIIQLDTGLERSIRAYQGPEMIRWFLNLLYKPEKPDRNREAANKAFSEISTETHRKIEEYAQETDNLSETIKEMRKKAANGN